MSQPNALSLLRERFGFESFRPGQEEVIGHLLAGRSAAAVFPTGSGKSLCYQLPALLLPGLTLVVSPLLALMKDQIDRLKRQGIAAERLDSTLSADEVRAVSQAVRAGQLRLLYVAPERFLNERFRELIQRTAVSLFAVDEAHCISEWGHNFRPDYLKLAGFASLCGAERTLALTATATPQVLEDICRGFAIEPRCAVRTGFYRANLTQLVTPLAAEARDATLAERLRTRPVGPTIVYVTLQRTAERMAAYLHGAGFPARAYHAGMEDDERAAVQDWFAASDEAIVVATIAFGMGIDKANIRYVYHYNLPKSLENYSQEIGRSGRDGQPSTCEMFLCADDLNVLENFVYGDTPSVAAVRGLVEELFRLGQEFDVSLHTLAGEFDIRPIVIRTLLTYLELDGYLQEGTPFYSKYQFQPNISSAEMLAHFEAERQEFLRKLLSTAEKAKVWFTIDLERAAQKTGSPRDRIVRALDYLAEQGWLQLKVEGVRNRFRVLKQPADRAALAVDLHRRILDRETREIGRLQQVLAWAGHDGCQIARLCEHFGEKLGRNCGHCSRCLNGRPIAVPSRAAVSLDESVWREATRLRAQTPDPLRDPRAFARFLCGISSPKLSRQRLSSHALFGALADVPFASVLSRAS